MAAKPSNSAAKAPTKSAPAPGRKAKPPERMVSGLLRMGAQTSLRVGASDDPLEREADMTAERVVSKSAGAGSAEPPPARPITRASWSVMPNTARRASPEPAEAEKADPETENKIQSMRGGGRPLSADERSFFEPRMGHDFSGVRVHEGSSANQAAGALQAKAFTLGSDVFMGSGQYNPGSESGKKLMAHELTHVVQQGGSSGTARRAPAAESNVIRRQSGFKNERARQKAIRAAVAWNRRRHTYTDGLALELFRIARTNTPFRRIRRTRRIDSNFVWLVGDTQRKLGLPVTGKLDQRTIRIALQRSGASIGTFAKIMIGIARKIVRNIPNWMFGPVPFLGILFKSAVNRLLGRISRLSASRIGRMIVSTAKAVTSWGFIQAFIKGVYKGFVEDGFIGTLKGIWEIVKLPWTIWQFAKKVFTALNDFRLMESLRGMFREMSGTVNWIRNNGRAIWNRIGRAARGTRNASLGGIFMALVRGAQGLGDRIGNSIATILIKFFGGGAANIASSLGGAAGRFAGNAGWVGLLAAITVGAGAAVAKAVQFVGPIIRVMSTPVGRVLRVVRTAWNSLSGFLTKATTGFGKWIHKISPTLSRRFIRLFGKMRRFFSRLVGRANRGPRRPGPGSKPKKPGRTRDRDRDGQGSSRKHRAVRAADADLDKAAKKQGIDAAEQRRVINSNRRRFRVPTLRITERSNGILISAARRRNQGRPRQLRGGDRYVSSLGLYKATNPSNSILSGDTIVNTEQRRIYNRIQEQINELNRKKASVGDGSTAFMMMLEQFRGGEGRLPVEIVPGTRHFRKARLSQNLLESMLDNREVQALLPRDGLQMIKDQIEKIKEARKWAKDFRQGKNPRLPRWASQNKGHEAFSNAGLNRVLREKQKLGPGQPVRPPPPRGRRRQPPEQE